MLRRLMLSAFALSAFLALAGCGASRLMAPDVATEDSPKPEVIGKNDPANETTLPSAPGNPGRGEDRPRREGDGRDTGL